MGKTPQTPAAPGNTIIKPFVAARQRTLTRPNKITDLASPNAPRTKTAGPKNSNGPKGGSAKSSVPANRTYLKSNNKIKAKAPKVTAAKLNTTPKTKFNRSTRVNYRQLRSAKNG